LNSEIIATIEAIERDKKVDRAFMVETLRNGILSAIHKMIKTDDVDLYDVVIDPQTLSITIKKGDEEVADTKFSRIAAQAAKQVIMYQLREAEREALYQEYQAKVGDIISGEVHRVEGYNIIVYLGEVEAILPRREQIRGEDYRQGELIKAFIVEVRKTNRGPDIILSRSHPAFVKRLFELEVPEISEGIVEIKLVSREAGARTKIAVFSQDEKIDCVGSCVGMRGQRVKNIVDELGGEKIDIIRWSSDIEIFIRNSLAPAELTKIILNEKEGERPSAEVLVKDDQLSLAIGKKGQNIRLASKLTGYHLDVRSTIQKIPLGELAGVGPKTEGLLKAQGINSVKDLLKLSSEDLQKIEGVGKKTAEKIMESAHKVFLSTGDAGLQDLSRKQEESDADKLAKKKQIFAEFESAFKQQTEGSSDKENADESAQKGSGQEDTPVKDESKRKKAILEELEKAFQESTEDNKEPESDADSEKSEEDAPEKEGDEENKQGEEDSTSTESDGEKK